MNGVISLHVGCGFEDQNINSLFYFNFCLISDIYFYQDDIDEDSESGEFNLIITIKWLI